MGKRAEKFSGTLEELISTVYSDIEDLHAEVQEVVDNMGGSEGLSQTQRYATLEEAAEYLEEAASSTPEVPEGLQELDVLYTQDTRRRESSTRAGRRDNIVSVLTACIDALGDYEVPEAEDGEDEDSVEDLSSEANDLANELQDTVDKLENCEFPGMMG